MTDQLSPNDFEDVEYGERARILIERATRFAQTLNLVAELAPRTPYEGGPVHSVELTDLFADTPGRGAGTRFMQQLIADADVLGMPLTVHPGTPRNTEFYARFEFERGGGFGSMRRLPSLPEDCQWLLNQESEAAPAL